MSITTIFNEEKLDAMWTYHAANGTLLAADVQYLKDKAAEVVADSNNSSTAMECIVKKQAFDFGATTEDVLHAVELYLRYNHEVIDQQDSAGETALHVCANRSLHEEMKLLLSLTPDSDWVAADNNIQNNWGDTAGHLAGIVNDTVTAQLLMDSDTTFLSTTNNWGETPEDAATWYGSTETAQLYADAVAAAA